MEANKKMYLTKAEADEKGLPSVQEQIDRHNAAVREARKADREFVKAFTPNKYGEYA